MVNKTYRKRSEQENEIPEYEASVSCVLGGGAVAKSGRGYPGVSTSSRCGEGLRHVSGEDEVGKLGGEGRETECLEATQ